MQEGPFFLNQYRLSWECFIREVSLNPLKTAPGVVLVNEEQSDSDCRVELMTNLGSNSGVLYTRV